MSGWQIAQLHFAHMLVSADSSQLDEFFATLDRINVLAYQAPGFVRRLQGDGGSATNFALFVRMCS